MVVRVDLVWDSSTCMRCVGTACGMLCPLRTFTNHGDACGARSRKSGANRILHVSPPSCIAYCLLPRDIHASADSFDCGSNCAQSPTSYTTVDPDAPTPADKLNAATAGTTPAKADTAPAATSPAKEGLAMLPPVPPGMQGYTIRDRHGPYGLSNGPAPI
jgi:hypothetical protein